MAPQMYSGTGVHQHPTSPGQPGSAQCRVGTIKKGLAGLHWHGAAGSRYLILAGMRWGHAGPCCGGLAPACCDGGVDVGSGECMHRWGVSPELVSPRDIATMPRYEDAAGSGVFTRHQPRPCTSTLGTPWAPSPASHTLPLHQGHGGHLRPPCATVTHSPFPCPDAQPSQVCQRGNTGTPIKVATGEIPAVFVAQQGSPRSPRKPQAAVGSGAWDGEPGWPGMKESRRQPVRGPVPEGFPKES